MADDQLALAGRRLAVFAIGDLAVRAADSHQAPADQKRTVCVGRLGDLLYADAPALARHRCDRPHRAHTPTAPPTLRHPKRGTPAPHLDPENRRHDFSGRHGHDLVVIGAGPAGVVAALRAARLGARTALVTRDQFGGMAANDGPVPVRTLAHAARLMREAWQLPRYGITTGEPTLDYVRLLDRVREVTDDVRTHSLLREDLQESGVTLHEHAGAAGFTDPHVIECAHAPRLHAAKTIICTGGVSRRLDLPGFELACTHSDAWTLTSTPPSMLVIGAGATGVQLASIFNAFGSRVTLFETAPRILMSEDQDVAAAVSAALAASGIQVLENAGTIDCLEPSPAGVRLTYTPDADPHAIDATIAVSRSAGSPTPPSSTFPPPASRSTHAATFGWTPSYAPARRTSSPPATSRDT